MSEPAAPELLSSDEEMLDRVGSLLRDGRRGFSVIVCPPELRGAATRYLSERRGKEIAEPRTIRTGDEVVATLARVEDLPSSEVESIAIEDSNVEVPVALNWNREKVRRGAHLLVWLASAEGLQAFVRHAPDAYSFRDHTLGLRGTVEPAGGSSAEEPPDVKIAKLLFQLPRTPEERAQAAVDLSIALLERGRIEESVRVATEGLNLIPAALFPNQRERRIRIDCLEQLANCAVLNGRGIDAFRASRQGAEECAASERTLDSRHLLFELSMADLAPVRSNRELFERAVHDLSNAESGGARYSMWILAANNARAAGEFRAALKYCDAALAIPDLPLDSTGQGLAARGAVNRGAGWLDRAGADIEAAEIAFQRAGYSLLPTTNVWAALWFDRAEIASAEQFLGSGSDIAVHAPGLELAVAWHRSGGDMRAAFGRLTERMKGWRTSLASSYVDAACQYLCAFLRSPRVPSLAPSDLDLALDLVDSAGCELIAYAADDPPWYRVLFPAYRAALLSLCGSRHEEAIRAASESITLARSLWKDALPFTTRTLVRCLARADRWPMMAPAIQIALDAAREADHLIELATVQSIDLVRLVRNGAPRAAIESALSALKHTFSEMDAPRVEAETWLEISPFLPPDCTFPDALEIADRAHDLFFDMPMPEMAARSMEWLGDIHAARGERARAESCYRLSLGTLDRYQLLPRKPVLEEKLKALRGQREGSGGEPSSRPA